MFFEKKKKCRKLRVMGRFKGWVCVTGKKIPFAHYHYIIMIKNHYVYEKSPYKHGNQVCVFVSV